MDQTDIALRIGQLAERVGVSPETLRAWERRYGVLRPERTAAGYRLYGREDEARATRMRTLIGEGWSAGQAARAIDADFVLPVPGDLEDLAITLRTAVLGFDGERAHGLLDGLLAQHGVDEILRRVILPVLRQIGEAWEAREASVAQEHFAAELLGGRMRALARGWDRGDGPRAVLACPSHELHDLGLLACGLALRRRGWRITYLGANTPAEALRDTVATVRPEVVVMGVLQSGPLARAVPSLAALGTDTRVLIGGAGAAPVLVAAAGATRLGDDPVRAADAIAAVVV